MPTENRSNYIADEIELHNLREQLRECDDDRATLISSARPPCQAAPERAGGAACTKDRSPQRLGGRLERRPRRNRQASPYWRFQLNGERQRTKLNPNLLLQVNTFETPGLDESRRTSKLPALGAQIALRDQESRIRLDAHLGISLSCIALFRSRRPSSQPKPSDTSTLNFMSEVYRYSKLNM